MRGQIVHCCMVQGRCNTRCVLMPGYYDHLVMDRAEDSYQHTVFPLPLTSSLIDGVSQTL